MKKHVIFAILLALLLGGCGMEEDDPDLVDFAPMPTIAIEDVEELPLLAPAMDAGQEVCEKMSAASEQGFFFPKMEKSEGGGYSRDRSFIHFYDFTTQESYPICAKPNCPHDDYLCNAYVENVHHLHYDGEYLYSVTWFGGQCWRMNPDGTDRKLLFAMEDSTPVTISSPVFCGDQVWFTTFGSMVDPETGELDSRERICCGDLKTGKITMLPIAFPKNRGSSTLQLYGIYGNRLIVRHSNMLDSMGGMYQKNEETIFTLDVETLEITILQQYQWDSGKNGTGVSYVTQGIDQGYMIFKLHPNGYEVVLDDQGKEKTVYPGQRLIVDLARNKAYRMEDQATSFRELIVDGKWIYLQWNDDRSGVHRVIQDLSTGQITAYPVGLAEVNIHKSENRSIGDYYIVNDTRGEGSTTGYIRKEDFWAGKDAIIPLPEWIFIGL